MARRPSVQAQIVDPHREHEPCVSSNTTACNGGGNNVPRNVTRWKQVWGEAWMCRSEVFVAGASCVLCGCAVSMIQSSKLVIRGELLLLTIRLGKSRPHESAGRFAAAAATRTWTRSVATTTLSGKHEYKSTSVFPDIVRQPNRTPATPPLLTCLLCRSIGTRDVGRIE